MKKTAFVALFLTLWSLSSRVYAQLPEAGFSIKGQCAGVAVTFTNLSNTTNVWWEFGDGLDTRKESPQHIYDEPGTYTVKLWAYLNERTNVAEQQITINASPTISFGYSREAHNDTVDMYIGQNLTISVAETYPNYQWYIDGEQDWESLGFTSISYTTSRAGAYKVWVKNTEGCVNEAPFWIRTSERPDDIIYTTIIVENNVVTPNNDGINDVLSVKYLGESDIYTKPLILNIYNKAGVLVYSSTNYANDWNAVNASGAELATGTYYYIATSEGRRGKTGYVDIIRSE